MTTQSTVEATEHRWKIGEFRDRLLQAVFKDQWKSDNFHVKGVPSAEFYLSFYPKGEKKDNFTKCGLYLDVKEFGGHPFIRLDYEMSIEDEGGKVLKKSENKEKFSSQAESQGWAGFVTQETAWVFAQNGPLFICCKVRPMDPITANDWSERMWATEMTKKLIFDFDTGAFSDLQLRVGEKVFKVSKIVLAAQSPVFETMFTSDFKEKRSGLIEIKGVDAEMFELMLRYMYSGKVDELDAYAAQLLPLADQYEVLSLIEICLESLIGTLSVDTALGDLKLMFAHDHSGRFKETILEFVRDNFEKMEQQQEWPKEFLAENPEISVALLYKMGQR